MLGTGISANDAFYISRNGMWVHVGGEELLIDFKRYPMLKSKTIGEISDFKIDKFGNLRWGGSGHRHRVRCSQAFGEIPVDHQSVKGGAWRKSVR